MLTTPVLLLAWRRPEQAERVLARIAAQRPERLFLACDGWDADASPELVDAVLATREVLDREPDWPCTVERRYADRNVGLRRAVAGAIDWFFGEVEEGIILEDDCLPHPDFFAYCTELLERYRDDPRVMCISGDGSAGIPVQDGSSYGFVRWPLIWGWASWRRAWRQYDGELEAVAALSKASWEQALPDPDERRVWQERLASLRSGGGPDTWDFVWTLSVLAGRGLCTLPAVNLVANIGMGPSATHSHHRDSSRSSPPGPILPLRHPSSVALEVEASRLVFDRCLGGLEERQRFRWERTLRGRFRRWLHRRVTPRLPRTLMALGRRSDDRRPWIKD